MRWRAETTQVTTTATAEAPEPEAHQRRDGNGTAASTNGTSKNGTHDPAKPAGDADAPVERRPSQAPLGHLRTRQVAR